jgi:Transposase and inactivated derivatives
METLKFVLESNPIQEKLILHSEQGIQVASRAFISFCADNEITQSMSRAGNPYDNGPLERFYNTLKSEFMLQYSFETDNDLNQGIYEYIFNCYNF